MARPVVVVDLEPVRRFSKAIDELQSSWEALPAPQRKSLSRVIWLHPDDLIIYRAPAPREG